MESLRMQYRIFSIVKFRTTTLQNKGCFYQLAVLFNRTNTSN